MNIFSFVKFHDEYICILPLSKYSEMRKLVTVKLFILIVSQLFAIAGRAQAPENWTSHQLIEPSALANSIKTGLDVPLIICVGPGATIPASVDIGMVNNKEGLNKLKAQLKKLAKDQKIVIYCGCCPFERCPDVRPAIDALKELKFTNYYLLDIPENIKKDWIDKGYPVAQ